MGSPYKDNTLDPGQTVFVNLDRFPWKRPTLQDVEDRMANPRKLGMTFNGLRFRIYDMNTAEGRADYEKDKAYVLNLIRLHKAEMIREASIVLATGDASKGPIGQHLHIVLEWVEVEYDSYREGPGGEPIKATLDYINPALEPPKENNPVLVDVKEFEQSDSDKTFL